MEFREQVNRLPGQLRHQAVRLQTIPRAWVLAAMTTLLVGIGLLLVQSAMA